MTPDLYCLQCQRDLPGDCTECWECGKEPVRRRKPTPSNPGNFEVPDTTGRHGGGTTHPGAAAPRRFSLTAALLPLLVVAGVLAYKGPTHVGRLTIQTQPPGAVVAVGERTLGVTPLQLEGDAGIYWITIRLENHEVVEAQVVIPKGGKAVADLPLQPIARRKPARRGPLDSSSTLRIADTQTTAQVQVAAAIREL